MLWLLVSAWVLGAASPSGVSAKRPESAVERHHRKGVHCMDVIERTKCAIEQFELVLEEDTRDRALVTDAMLRLIRLYRKSDDTEALKGVLRRYWDVGVRRQSRGHVPYGTRYFPAEFDVFFAVNIGKVRDAPVTTAAGEGTAQFVFTCDEQERADIRMTERWARAAEIGARTGQSPSQVIYAEMDKRSARRDARRAAEAERKSPRREREVSAGSSQEPIFSSTTCDVARALGFDAIGGWTSMAGGASHQNFARSMFVAGVPSLDKKLAAAERSGRVRDLGDEHWVIEDLQFAEQDIHLLRVDLDQVLVARDDMVKPVLEARRRRRRKMNRELEKLALGVPKDSAAYLVMTRSAVSGMSSGSMRRSSAAFLQALLPKPKGLQISVSVHDEAGVFTRVPTDNAVKGRLLVRLAQSMIEGQAEDDPEAADMIDNLDIAEAGDRKALLAAYLISGTRLRDLMWQ